MTADCRARGVPIVWVLVPRVGRKSDALEQPALIQTARTAGFSHIVDLTGAFDDIDPAKLAVDRDDFHPNARGHARLAQRLDQTLTAIPELDGICGTRLRKADGANQARRYDGRGKALDLDVRPADFRATPGGASK
jgi:hypothetical protein